MNSPPRSSPSATVCAIRFKDDQGQTKQLFFYRFRPPLKTTHTEVIWDGGKVIDFTGSQPTINKIDHVRIACVPHESCALKHDPSEGDTPLTVELLGVKGIHKCNITLNRDDTLSDLSEIIVTDVMFFKKVVISKLIPVGAGIILGFLLALLTGGKWRD